MSCWCVVGISGRNPVRTRGGASVDPGLIEANSYRILRSLERDECALLLDRWEQAKEGEGHYLT